MEAEAGRLMEFEVSLDCMYEIQASLEYRIRYFIKNQTKPKYRRD